MSFTEKGQVNAISLQRTGAAPRGATTGHHSCRTDHVLRPHAGGCPANPDCPHQPASRWAPFCTKPHSSSDPAWWCARLENGGVTLEPLELAPYFQPALLILISRTEKGGRQKEKRSLVSHLLGDVPYGQGGQAEPSTISPPHPHPGSFQRGGRGSSQCKASQNVTIALTTSGQFLCRFTPSCLSTCSSLCLERIKPRPPGQLLLGL